jgi:lysyl-tRNA synthetase class 2
MKRLLAAGYPDIYSICRVYRDGECGKRHLVEFTMIEWYRRDFRLSDIIDDTTALIAAVLGRTDLTTPAVVWDYQELFRDKLGVDPFENSIEQLASCAAADKTLRTALHDRRDAWLDLLLATKLAPTFADTGLTVVKHYPASQAALARLCPQNDQVSDRFEVFFGSLELANGYVELIDAAEQSRRIKAELALRRDRCLPAYPADKQLLSALESGLPPCAGVALGFERLHMLDAHTDDIRDVVTFAP